MPPAIDGVGGVGVAASARVEELGLVDRPACPLCGAARATAARVHIDFPDIPVVRCVPAAAGGQGCGFIYPARAMGPEAMARYYREDFASDWHKAGQRLNSYVNANALALLLDLRNARTFLDVGTGYGYLLKRLAAVHGIACTGTEVSVTEAHYARDVLGLAVINAPLERSGLAEGGFDAAGCFEVIEHVADPVAFVRELARYVKPGGVVVINTDNFESRAVRELGARFSKWIPHSHVSDFAPATLRRCVRAAGLEPCGELSYTAWENALRAWRARGRPPANPAECFDLRKELAREMNRTYRLWPLRLAMSQAWFAMDYRRDLEGSLMFLAARKPA